ncbi:MAG: IS1 family transposase [Okeania sp. SIO2C2]|uniref:hypothetical protein n=1 Tax=Okeania sp. SIO2C2 TaxID=2607787 RepID=UPI0013B5F3AC|nr:IS1 family transposase [Okeania sp. SIO2C2]
MDVETREIVGADIGDRSQQSAQNLWHCLPGVYGQCAVCYSDFGEAYEIILPSMRHQALGKETGKTSDIERFNNTMGQQRIGRLVRKT